MVQIDKRKIMVLFLLLITLFGCFEFAFAKEYPVLRVCSEPGFVPFEMRTSQGVWDGYEIVLARNFAKETEREVQFVDIRFEGLLPALIAKRGCDIVASAVGINAERQKMVLFSDAIYQSAYAGLVRAADAERLKNFAVINQKTTKIAVQQGTEASLYVKQTFQDASILVYDDNSAPVLAVLTQKADIFIDDSVYCTIAAKRKSGKLSIVSPEVFPANEYGAMGFAFRKKDKKLRNEFNQYLRKIQKNGAWDQLKNDYFDKMIWEKNFPE